jgi:transcriptional regulator with XRE-family HTH domain
MDSIERLRRQVEELDKSHDPDWELYGVLLDVTEGIVKRMIEQNVRRSDLADRLGTSRAYVTKLLDGQENMTLKTLVRVANALEMKVDTRLIPRERAAKPAKHAEVKTAMGRKMRSGSPRAKVAVKKRVAVAARTKR